MKIFKYETEEEQLEAVKENPYVIYYINNPSEIVQLETVRQDSHTIAHINNPTEKVIKYLLDNYSSNIDVIQLLSARIGKDWYDKLSDEDKLRIELGD